MEEGSTPPGRGILSMQDLSHGVIRVDSEEKLSVLTLQDVGSVMPGGETEPLEILIHLVEGCIFNLNNTWTTYLLHM